MGSRCCVNCFAHEWLRDYVRDNSDALGDCAYCGRKGVDVIDISALYHPFENLMELYVPSDDQRGEMLVDLIQSDYEVFEEDLYTSDQAARLLEEIMQTGWDDDSGESLVDAHELYYRRSSLWHHTTMAEAWEEFCDKVKEDPTHEPNLLVLLDEELARMEVELPSEIMLYRARVGFLSGESGGNRPFESADIGAPPPERAKPGRANAEGEVVLYAADQEATAIAEVRPWRGLLVSVVEVRVTRNLRLVDLSKPPHPRIRLPTRPHSTNKSWRIYCWPSVRRWGNRSGVLMTPTTIFLARDWCSAFVQADGTMVSDTPVLWPPAELTSSSSTSRWCGSERRSS